MLLAGVWRMTEGPCQEKKSLIRDSLFGYFILNYTLPLLANGAYMSESVRVDTDAVFAHTVFSTYTLPLL